MTRWVTRVPPPPPPGPRSISRWDRSHPYPTPLPGPRSIARWDPSAVPHAPSRAPKYGPVGSVTYAPPPGAQKYGPMGSVTYAPPPGAQKYGPMGAVTRAPPPHQGPRTGTNKAVTIITIKTGAGVTGSEANEVTCHGTGAGDAIA
ncbi:leucine-rich repeat extensin-like protein 1 [Hyalella azteca]|uniref:Leucine-rich repeat extensin-like protein 1 n=1 Tax=Hyalella azteca TaxID=294128 RepID=A0A8B7NHP5_HYAAZ|nr:leucine-rich repeat extensin-like protein 1 [Hyalella azteca]